MGGGAGKDVWKSIAYNCTHQYVFSVIIMAPPHFQFQDLVSVVSIQVIGGFLVVLSASQ